MLRKLIVVVLCLSLVAASTPAFATQLRPTAQSFTVEIRSSKAQRDVAASHPIFQRGNDSRFGNDVARGRVAMTLKANMVIENDMLRIETATIRHASWAREIILSGEIPAVDGVFWGRLDALINTSLGLEEGAAAVYFNPQRPQETVINITIGIAGTENEMAALLFGEPHGGISQAVEKARTQTAGLPSLADTAEGVHVLSVPEIIHVTHVTTAGTSLLGRSGFKSDPPQWDNAADGLVNMTNIFERSSFVNGGNSGYVDVRVFTDTVAVQRYLGRNWNGEWPYVGADEIFFRISSPYIGVQGHYPHAPAQREYTILGLVPRIGTWLQFIANAVANLFRSIQVRNLGSALEVRLYNLDINADFTFRDSNNHWIPKSRSEEAVNGGAFVRLFYNEGIGGFRPIEVRTKVWYLASVNGSFIWVITPTVSHQWQSNMDRQR